MPKRPLCILVGGPRDGHWIRWQDETFRSFMAGMNRAPERVPLAKRAHHYRWDGTIDERGRRVFRYERSEWECVISDRERRDRSRYPEGEP